MSGINEITYEGAAAVTTSDTTADPAGTFAGLYIGGAGDVKVQTLKGQAVTFKAVPVGTTLRIACTRVWTTGTSASNILGLIQMPYKGPPAP